MRMASALALVAVLLCAWGARADVYLEPSDFAVACLDLNTGREYWRTPPLEVTTPRSRSRTGSRWSTARSRCPSRTGGLSRRT